MQIEDVGPGQQCGGFCDLVDFGLEPSAPMRHNALRQHLSPPGKARDKAEAIPAPFLFLFWRPEREKKFVWMLRFS